MDKKYKVIYPDLKKGIKYFCKTCADTGQMKILKNNGEIILSKCACSQPLPIEINK